MNWLASNWLKRYADARQRITDRRQRIAHEEADWLRVLRAAKVEYWAGGDGGIDTGDLASRPLTAKCPVCGATPGVRCVTASGLRVAVFHRGRR